jgi:hypothetical protein
MKPVRRVALLLSLALAALALGLTAGDVGARPKKPEVVEPPPPPPPPPPMPDVGLAERFIRDAAAYADYMRQTAAISPTFADPSGVAQSLRTGVAYEPGQFQRGEVAYAAIAALQDRSFVAAVREAGSTPEGRYAILAKIFADPANVLVFHDAPTAAGLAKAALAGDGMRLLTLGKAVRKEAYDIQHQPWSKDDVADRDARLGAAKLLSTSPRAVSDIDAAQMRAAVAPDLPPAGPPQPAPPPYSPLVIRATALAALAAIGQAGDKDVENLGWMSEDYFTQHCLEHAKKELNECLAVAKPNYEDIFCLGQPTMMYTGECVVKGAGATIPLEIITRSFRIPPVHKAVRKHKR